MVKRATITFPDELEAKLERYLSRQAAPPSLSKLVQVALDEYFISQEWVERQVRPPKRELDLSALPVAREGSGETDVSINHDAHFVEVALNDRD